MLGAFQDVRFALRQFRTRPGFAAAAVVVLGLGLGANTAIFSLVNAYLWRPLPYPNAGRIAALYERNIAGEKEIYNEAAPGTFADWRRAATTFEQIAAYDTGPMTVGGTQATLPPHRVDAASASRELFTILGVRPLRGRIFTAEEDRPGAPRVAIIGYGLWQQDFGGQPDVVGRQIHLDGSDCQIIGVMPQRFAFPEATTQVWIALAASLSPSTFERHNTHFLNVIGLLKPGITTAQGRADVDAISARYYKAHPEDAIAPGANAVPLQFALVRESRSTVLLLWAAVACVLLIACVNVANLLLTRAAGRAREIAIRAATGAGRWRVVRLFLTESLLLSVSGAALGFLLATYLMSAAPVRALIANNVFPEDRIPFDFHVFLFTAGAAFAVGVASGLFPALHFSRGDLANALRDGGRSHTQGHGQSRFRAGLTAVEVAVSLVLLIAAGLLLRSFSRLMQVNPGIRTDHTITMMVPNIDRPPARTYTLFRELPQRLESIPGVLAAGMTSCLPATGHCSDNFFYIDGKPANPGHVMDALQRNADGGYFAAIGLPLLRGRTFTEADGIGPDRKNPRKPAIIISQSLAKTYFPGEDPIGRRLTLNVELQAEKLQGLPAAHYEIVGVVGDAPEQIDRSSQPTFYMPIADQTKYEQVYVVLHTAGDAHSVTSAARREISRLDPDLAVDQVRTIQDLIGESASSHRSNMFLFGGFAALALLLAAFGLYSVLSYTVMQRRAEIGIRMALGATGSEVAGYVFREGMKPAIGGLLVGLPAAAISCRLLDALLFGVAPLDPLTFTLAPAALILVAALACYVPVLRAVRIDPAITLRSE